MSDSSTPRAVGDGHSMDAARPSRPVVYPLVVATWLVLRMASANSASLRGPSDLVRPLALSLLAAAVAWLVAFMLSPRDRHRRALLALLGLLWFSFLPAISRAVEESPLGSVGALGTATLSAWLMLPLFAGVMLLRRDLAPLSRYLDTSALVLLLLPLPGLRGLVLQREGRTPSGYLLPMEWPLEPEVRQAAVAARSGARPDVYLIVLDKYTGARSLRRHYAYDNTAFLDSLRARGFVIPDSARANYPITHLALSAMLNWRLLDGSPVDADADEAMRLSRNRIESNRTVALFRELGYRFHFVPSTDAVTIRNRHAHASYDADPTRWSDFEVEWWRSTALGMAYSPLCRRLGVACATFRRAETSQSAPAIERRLEALRGIADSAGPKFVFAHFLVPHEPYVFDASCGHLPRPYIPPQTTSLDVGEDEARVKRAYVAQVQCVNRLMLALVDSLDRHSRERPVIVLQSDHGHGRLYPRLPLDQVPADRVAERMDIFGAYRFPGAERRVYEGISPVNVLPAVVEGTFAVPLPRHPDAGYWAAWNAPFRLAPVD